MFQHRTRPRLAQRKAGSGVVFPDGRRGHGLTATSSSSKGSLSSLATTSSRVLGTEDLHIDGIMLRWILVR